VKFKISKKLVFVLFALVVLAWLIVSFGTKEVGEKHPDWSVFNCAGERWFAIATTTKNYTVHELVLDDGRIEVVYKIDTFRYTNASFTFSSGGTAGWLEEKGQPKVYKDCELGDPTKFEFPYFEQAT